MQARLGWAVGWAKPAFWGRDALLAERAAGPRAPAARVARERSGRAAARHARRARRPAGRRHDVRARSRRPCAPGSHWPCWSRASRSAPRCRSTSGVGDCPPRWSIRRSSSHTCGEKAGPRGRSAGRHAQHPLAKKVRNRCGSLTTCAVISPKSIPHSAGRYSTASRSWPSSVQRQDVGVPRRGRCGPAYRPVAEPQQLVLQPEALGVAVERGRPVSGGPEQPNRARGLFHDDALHGQDRAAVYVELSGLCARFHRVHDEEFHERSLLATWCWRPDMAWIGTWYEHGCGGATRRVAGDIVVGGANASRGRPVQPSRRGRVTQGLTGCDADGRSVSGGRSTRAPGAPSVERTWTPDNRACNPGYRWNVSSTTSARFRHRPEPEPGAGCAARRNRRRSGVRAVLHRPHGDDRVDGRRGAGTTPRSYRTDRSSSTRRRWCCTTGRRSSRASRPTGSRTARSPRSGRTPTRPGSAGRRCGWRCRSCPRSCSSAR